MAVVHFNSKRGAQVPILMRAGAGASLKCSLMLAAAHRIRGFVLDTALCDRPFASLWLAKACVVPAGL